MDTLPSGGVGVAEAAAYTGIDRRQILRLIKRGDIKGSRKLAGPTGAWIIPAAEIKALITRTGDAK